MPSFFHLMVALGGTALVVGIMILWLNEPQPPPSLTGSFLPSAPEVVGKSTLSHGGPPRHSLAASPTPHFQVGQKVLVRPEQQDGAAIGLRGSSLHSSASSSSEDTRIVSAGTAVVITGMHTAEPAPGLMEQYYEITLPDGRKSWLPERVLRAVN